MFIQTTTALPSIVQGGTWDPVLTVRDSGTNAIVSLAPWIGASKGVRLQLRLASNTATLAADVTITIVGDGTAGQLQLLLNASVTKNMTVADVIGDIELFDSSSGTEIVRKPSIVTTTVVKEYTLP